MKPLHGAAKDALRSLEASLLPAAPKRAAPDFFWPPFTVYIYIYGGYMKFNFWKEAVQKLVRSPRLAVLGGLHLRPQQGLKGLNVFATSLRQGPSVAPYGRQLTERVGVVGLMIDRPYDYSLVVLWRSSKVGAGA